MVAFNPLTRQPTNLDFASPSQFRFTLLKVPNVEYFVTGVNLPGVSFSGDATINTRFTSVHFMGDSMEFEDLEVTFLVNEALENYREIHDWMVGIGFPKDYAQTRDLLGAGADRFPTTTGANLQTDPGKVKYGPTAIGGIYSDATLLILSSKNRPVTEVRFSEVFPTALSGLQYSQTATDVEYLTATVTLQYRLYEFANVNASSTTVTSS